MFLLGMPFYSAFIPLPQRFQGVNQTSAERAGILLLPVTLLTPVGAIISGGVMGKLIAAEHMLIISAAVVSVGVGLISSLPVDASFWVGTYGYEIIIGLGLGLASPPYYYLLYTSVEEKDAAVGTGALNMVRTLGGAVAVAICTAVHHSVLHSELPAFLTSDEIALIEESNAHARKLPPASQKELGEVFGRSYNRQFQVILAFSCLNVLVAIVLGIVRKQKGIFGKVPERKEENEFMKKQPTDTVMVNTQSEKDPAQVEKTAATGVVEAGKKNAGQADEISPTA